MLVTQMIGCGNTFGSKLMTKMIMGGKWCCLAKRVSNCKFHAKFSGIG